MELQPFVITIQTIHESFELTVRAYNLADAEEKAERLHNAISNGHTAYSIRPKFIKLGDVA